MKKLKKLSLENEMKKKLNRLKRKSERIDLWMTLKCPMRWKKSFSIRFRITNTTKGIKSHPQKKKSKLVIGALAAVLILVCGSVMTSVGSKSYWKTLWNKEAGDETLSYVDVENMETMETEDFEVLELDKEIVKVMGDYLVRMEYKPKDMVLKRYIIDKEQRMAVLFYQYGEEVIKYYMYTNSTDSSFGEKQLINY